MFSPPSPLGYDDGMSDSPAMNEPSGNPNPFAAPHTTECALAGNRSRIFPRRSVGSLLYLCSAFAVLPAVAWGWNVLDGHLDIDPLSLVVLGVSVALTFLLARRGRRLWRVHGSISKN